MPITHKQIVIYKWKIRLVFYKRNLKRTNSIYGRFRRIKDRSATLSVKNRCISSGCSHTWMTKKVTLLSIAKPQGISLRILQRIWMLSLQKILYYIIRGRHKIQCVLYLIPSVERRKKFMLIHHNAYLYINLRIQY